MKAYKYLFYRLYKYAERTERSWGHRGIPEWVALFSVSILLIFNIGMLFFASKYFFGFELDISEAIGLLLVGIIYFINYLIFIKDKKYLEIAKSYSKETNRQSLFRTTIVWLYIILSFVLLYTILSFSKSTYWVMGQIGA